MYNYWRKHRAAQSRSGGQEDILLQDLVNVIVKRLQFSCLQLQMSRTSSMMKRSWIMVLTICLAHCSHGAVLPKTLTVHFSVFY